MGLIIFGGLPGAGKSTLAEALGIYRKTPVFAVDWLLGALRPFEVLRVDNAPELGCVLLTTLASRQLLLQQSAIVDHPTHTQQLRQTWQNLASEHRSPIAFIEVICSDPLVHRMRLEGRTCAIPG